MANYPESMERAIRALAGLPAIGRKSAQRLSHRLLEMPETEVGELLESIRAMKERVHPCPVCGNWTEDSLCAICRDESRDRSLLTVVEDSAHIVSLEKTKNYRGIYHVLGGLLSPMKQQKIEDLRVDRLLDRLDEGEIKEVILALSPTLEGETTTQFLKVLLEGRNVKLTKIAMGIPMGANLEYFDEMSFYRALEERREV